MLTLKEKQYSRRRMPIFCILAFFCSGFTVNLMRSQRILVTAALPYANGYIHLGHCAGAYLPADLYVRFQRMNGRDILFVCGSDEHGAAISISAEKEKTTPRAIIDKYHTANEAAFRRFGMSFDVYSRTSLPGHYETSQEFFLELYNKGVFSEKEEEQFYDADARMFLPDRFVEGICPHCSYDKARGDQCDRCGAYYNQLDLKNPRSLVSGKTPEVKRTTHWYFRLGDFQTRLEEYIGSHEGEWKDNVVQQSRSWLRQGLGDRAITRDLDWGIPVPLETAAGKVIYVWFEAPIGYISATKVWAEQQGTPDAWKKWWQDEETRYVAFIGKDNIVFHTLIFPAMLMAKGGYILPDNVPGNEFLNLEGEKFSKSRNWGIDLREYLADFPEDQHVDALRYALAMALPEARDTDFTWKEFQVRVGELANKLGNFVNRSMQFMLARFDGKVPSLPDKFRKLPEAWKLLAEDVALAGERDAEQLVEELAPKYLHYFSREDVLMIVSLLQGAHIVASKYEHFRLRDAVSETMNMAQAANKYFNDTKPWEAIKSKPDECARTLYVCAQIVRSLGVAFAPVLPFASEAMLAMVQASDVRSWAAIGQPLVPEGTEIALPPAKLFEQIPDEKIAEQVAKLGAGVPAAAAPVEPETLLTINDFKAVKLRTGRVLHAERVPKSDKLLKLLVDIGSGHRQIVAGIGKHYEPESLVGRAVVVVVNLQPAKLMGVESQGMLLAANTADGRLALVQPDSSDIVPGTEVR